MALPWPVVLTLRDTTADKVPAHPVCVGLGVLGGVRVAVGHGESVALWVSNEDTDPTPPPPAAEALPSLLVGLGVAEVLEDTLPLPVGTREKDGWDDPLG